MVILLVADNPSKELLTEYTVPLGHLKPFHQYHLELVQVLNINLGYFVAFSKFHNGIVTSATSGGLEFKLWPLFLIIFMDIFTVPFPVS